jgi:predicted HicB family RNase H-like nuclease
MAHHTPPAVTPATPIGPDVDLDAEDVRLADGSRLTEDRAAEIVDEVRRRAGRPSLTGEAAASPRITFRIPHSTRDRAAEIAAQEGKTVSQLAREALEERVAAGERPA